MNVRNFNDRSCERYRPYFDAYLDHELPVETQQDIQQHVVSCQDCARILESRGQIKQLVRNVVTREEAPIELCSGTELSSPAPASVSFRVFPRA